MPPFNHLHPAIVHFAIAPLALAPFLILASLAWRSQRRGLALAALFLLAAGTAAAVVSMLTGQAAERFARATPALRAAVLEHEASAQWVLWTSAAATLLIPAAVLIAAIRRREGAGLPETILLMLGLMASLLAAAAVLRTGHLGGTMVHVLGTHAQPPP